MKPNRRNYYRVLHVQPEAPVEIIKASYRALMGPLRQHPDKGGDHATATLINEAYAVLTDQARRLAYDASMGDKRQRARRVNVAPNGARNGNARAAATESRPGAAAPAPIVRPDTDLCAFCGGPAPGPRPAMARCARCDAPLFPPPRSATAQRETIGRRASRRAPKDHPVILLPAWRATPLRATLRDLSLTGLRLVAPVMVPPSTVIRVTNADVDAVAVVVSCRRSAHQCTIHAELLAVDLAQREGVFVATRA